MRTAVLAVLLLACHHPSADAAPPQPAQATLLGSGGESTTVEVELAQTPAQREVGLMNRDRLGASQGMLFLFPQPSQQVFWMKNTLIPLDMIFIADDLTVVGVVDSAEPLTLTPRQVNGRSRYVLEVNGGFAKQHRIGAGSRVRFTRVPAPPNE